MRGSITVRTFSGSQFKYKENHEKFIPINICRESSSCNQKKASVAMVMTVVF